MDEKELEAYAYNEGYKKGKNDAEKMKLDADGCCCCAFEHVEPWEMPCHMCKRNCKDYWRANACQI